MILIGTRTNMTKKEAIEVIASQIAWCVSNPEPPGKPLEFKKGFVEGLRQAKRLLQKLPART